MARPSGEVRGARVGVTSPVPRLSFSSLRGPDPQTGFHYTLPLLVLLDPHPCAPVVGPQITPGTEGRSLLEGLLPVEPSVSPDGGRDAPGVHTVYTPRETSGPSRKRTDTFTLWVNRVLEGGSGPSQGVGGRGRDVQPTRVRLGVLADPVIVPGVVCRGTSDPT